MVRVPVYGFFVDFENEEKKSFAAKTTKTNEQRAKKTFADVYTKKELNDNVFVLHFRHVPLCILPSKCLLKCPCPCCSIKVYPTHERFHLIDLHIEVNGRSGEPVQINILSKINYTITKKDSFRLLFTLHRLRFKGVNFQSFLLETAREYTERVSKSMVAEDILEMTHVFQERVFRVLKKNMRNWCIDVTLFHVLSVGVYEMMGKDS